MAPHITTAERLEPATIEYATRSANWSDENLYFIDKALKGDEE